MIGPVSVDDGTEGLARPPVRGHVGDVEAVGGQLQPRPQLQSLAASRPRCARHPPHCSGVQLIHVFILNADFLHPPSFCFCTDAHFIIHQLSLCDCPCQLFMLRCKWQIKVLLCKYVEVISKLHNILNIKFYHLLCM